MMHSFGEVVLVNFPFSSNLGIKKRPAVIISKSEFNDKKDDLILLAITSQINKLTIGEALINEWQNAGLLKSSAFKSVIFTVEKKSIDKTIGKLTTSDKNILLNCLRQIIQNN